MKKSSYLAELEFRYAYALRCPSQPVGESTSYLNILLEYVDKFHDTSDVVDDVRSFLTLIGTTD